MAHRDKVDKEVQRIIKLGIIQRLNSPYINPVVHVINKDGTIRLCLDARRLNEILIEEWECPETAEVLFQKCEGMNVMSNLDITSSFCQVPLHSYSPKYTAVQYGGQRYEFRIVPFGLKTSTAALVRGLDHALQGLGEQIISFVDDTLITSVNNELHLEHLDAILNRLQKNNLTLNLTKSHFFRKETKFLGFILTTEGVKPDPEKLQNIQEFSAPKNVKQLQGFLELINFYSRFSEEHAGYGTKRHRKASKK